MLPLHTVFKLLSFFAFIKTIDRQSPDSSVKKYRESVEECFHQQPTLEPFPDRSACHKNHLRQAHANLIGHV